MDDFQSKFTGEEIDAILESAKKQPDYEQNDSTQPDFIKNRPFYDTRRKSWYSQAENPNPISFDNVALNYSFYKVSDLIIPRNEIFDKTSVVTESAIPYTFAESGIVLETEDFVIIKATGVDFNFLFAYKTGSLPFTYLGYSLSCDVPETGIYSIRGLGTGIPEGRTFSFTTGEIKQIEPKYLPVAGDGVGASNILWVTTGLRLQTMSLENLSHNAVEIKNALDSGKIVKVKAELYGFNKSMLFDVSYYSDVPSEIGYILVTLNSFAYLDLGEGQTLYFIQSFINTNVDTLETSTTTQAVAVNITA